MLSAAAGSQVILCAVSILIVVEETLSALCVGSSRVVGRRVAQNALSGRRMR